MILLFLAFHTYADSVSLYNIKNNLKTYTAGSNLAEVFEHERTYKLRSAQVADEFKEKNHYDLQNLKQLSVTQGKMADAQQIWHQLVNHPIIGNNPINPYNQNSSTGFCFGRALWVEHELLKHGVRPDQIRKIFVIGELSDGNIIWDYHVATMYIDPQGRQWMIDSLFEEMYQLDEWFQKMNKYALNPERPLYRIYVAEADKFQAINGEFNSFDVWNPIYNSYFFDLLIWL